MDKRFIILPSLLLLMEVVYEWIVRVLLQDNVVLIKISLSRGKLW